MLSDLAEQAGAALTAEGVAQDEQDVLYQIDIRYHGQGMKLTVDMAPDVFARSGLAGVTGRFDAEHEQLFTFALDAEHEIVGLRAVVQGAEKNFINAETGQGGAIPAPPGCSRRGYTPMADGATGTSTTAPSCSRATGWRARRS
jgi:N-methylhydantoinase A